MQARIRWLRWFRSGALLAAALSAITIVVRANARSSGGCPRDAVTPLVADSSVSDAMRWLGRSHWL